jgi:hypothetical protein
MLYQSPSPYLRRSGPIDRRCKISSAREASRADSCGSLRSSRVGLQARPNTQKIPYHCDGLFVPESWADHLRASEVISSPKWHRLSDHNPVVSRFGQASLVADGRSASDRRSGGNGSDTDLQ